MEIKQAIDLLEQGLELANKKGAYSLNDATVIKQAFEIVKQELSNLDKEAPVKESKELKKVK